MSDNTLFQQLVENSEAEEMIADLEDLESLVPEETDIEEIEGWEMAVTFTPDDVPRMIEELEELVGVE